MHISELNIKLSNKYDMIVIRTFLPDFQNVYNSLTLNTNTLSNDRVCIAVELIKVTSDQIKLYKNDAGSSQAHSSFRTHCNPYFKQMDVMFSNI